ncbi:MAG TPA: hypothetical protein VGG92_01635 [Caulobacteraceae bacterium]|jgi:hypothetical protein
MVHRAAAAIPLLHERPATLAFVRHSFMGATIASWVIVFAMAALVAAWFGGAWTPPGKPIPGASWFTTGLERAGAWRA